MKSVQAIHDAFRGRGLLVLAVDGRDRVDTVKRRFETDALTFMPLIDEGGAVWKSYGVTTTPTFCAIGTDGTVAFTQAGIDEGRLRDSLNGFMPGK